METRLGKKRDPAASLGDDLFVRVLSRLPAKSICRCKGVSRPWRRLISHPDHRKKLPQTLAGFLYGSISLVGGSISSVHHFACVAGYGGAPSAAPSISFLRGCAGGDVVPLDSCNGLLLCRCYQPGPHGNGRSKSFNYAVCNPITKKWVMFSDGSGDGEARTAFLGFDPAVSSHFHVVEYVTNGGNTITGVLIYSSKAAAWNFKKSGWGSGIKLSISTEISVFLNGFLHSVTSFGTIVAVDMEGKSWRMIRTPPGTHGHCIHQTQGRLCMVTHNNVMAPEMSIWVLEDYGTDEWILKHTISSLKLFEGRNLWPYPDYKMIAVHPDCNLIFFVFGPNNTLAAYQMNRREMCIIRNLGLDCFPPYLPYVPWYGESLANDQ
ncbi:hypothetical protein ACP70R_028991 [Stipagrostis hirtigluma subsp. patula]